MSLFAFGQSKPGLPGKTPNGARRLLPKTPAGWLAWGLAPVALIGSLMAADAAGLPGVKRAWQSTAMRYTGSAQPASAPSGPKMVDLPNAPLYTAPVADKPTIALALSAEFPMAGALYAVPDALIVGNDALPIDDSYSNEKEYLGYYDAESCYEYIDNPADTIADGYIREDYKRFRRTGAASSRKCDAAFSGNFLNWASGSFIDMLRVALSGGDRYIDTPDLTVLQRAMIPNDRRDSACMWNTTHFPGKKLKRNGGGNGTYYGAIPLSMVPTDMSATEDGIYVANILDRIYFGRNFGGTCHDTASYTLGSHTGTVRDMGPVEDRTGLLPYGSRECPTVNGDCRFTGVREVWYGLGDSAANPSWKVAPAVNGIVCNNTTFGVPAPPASSASAPAGATGRCYLADYSGRWSNTHPVLAALPDGAFNSDGFFYARVQVCNTGAAGSGVERRDYGFCTRYPNGKDKPTGAIQKYSDQMRVAAFGYLLDNDNARDSFMNHSGNASPLSDRYGGVLRAPMKYVGHKTYDINGRENTSAGGNAKAEWDAHTGVFYQNPEVPAAPASAGSASAASAPVVKGPTNISGVINYLNRFGRSGKPGVYKNHDFTEELHYEVLRYLQGLEPSAAAVDVAAGRVMDMADGFPYFKSWKDPYGDGRDSTKNFSCLKSNIVIIGDSNIYHDGRLPAENSERNIPNINQWRNVVEALEGGSANYTDGDGGTQTAVNPNPVAGLKLQGQIMGTAYWARTHDIRGSQWTETAKRRKGLRVKTIVFDVNEYGKQNWSSANQNRVRRLTNPLYTAAKYGGFETDPNNPGRNPYNTKGNPFRDEKIGQDNGKVWEKFNEPGEASSYYFFNTLKNSPAREMLSAFDDIFRSGVAGYSIGGSGMSTGSRVTADSKIYAATFDTGTWSGNIEARALSQNPGASNAVVIGEPSWKAAERLDAQTPGSRKIFMGKATRDGGVAAFKFTWADIPAEVKPYFKKRPVADAQEDALGPDRVDYLRGNRIKEGDPFRIRKSVLGDIVNSNVSYSGKPRKRFEGDGFTAFYDDHGSRRPVVFAGANDGMLHAFDAATGNEVFAYIPSWMGPKLSALTDPGYVSAHQNYVDGLSVVAEARTGASDSRSEDWKTVLVSGTGAGGSGVFALDVTNPATFSQDNVMWEFTRADDPNIGQVLGAPKIMKIKTVAATATTPAAYRWFAVVASGVNNHVAGAVQDAGMASRPPGPALFLLALDKPASANWTQGSNYYRIDIPTDTALTHNHAAGVINFSALYGSQREMTDIYFGDLHGQLWRLQFAGKTPGDWNMDKLSFFKTGDTAKPLYVARTGGTAPGKVQAISAAPALFVGPRVEGRETFHVAFGTGKYMEVADKTSTTQHSVYAVFDNGKSDGSTHGAQAVAGSTDVDATPARVIAGRQNLKVANINTATRKITVPSFVWGYPQEDGHAQRAGWYFDLPDSGERVDQAARDLGALTAAINSKIPPADLSASNGGGCTDAGSGGGNKYVLNINTGAADYKPSTLGLLGAPLFVTGVADTVASPADSAGRSIVTTTMQRIEQGQNGLGSASADAVDRPEVKQAAKRLSWRQIFNYRELKNATPTATVVPAAGATESAR